MQKLSLKRLTLDELAEVLPAVKEKEQCECIGGGDYYYSNNGTYLGYSGSSYSQDTIMVKRPSAYITYGGMEVPVYNGTSLSMSQVGYEEQRSIVTSLARDLGYSGFVRLYTGGSYGNCSPTMGIGLNENFVSYGNYNNIMCTLVHEINHWNTLGDHKTNKDEYEAQIAMRNSSYFANASAEFKNNSDRLYNYYKSQVDAGRGGASSDLPAGGIP